MIPPLIHWEWWIPIPIPSKNCAPYNGVWPIHVVSDWVSNNKAPLTALCPLSLSLSLSLSPPLSLSFFESWKIEAFEI